MRQRIFIRITLFFVCICLLFGCSSKSQDASDFTSGSQSEIQVMAEEDFQKYFQQVFDAKGNALDKILLSFG